MKLPRLIDADDWRDLGIGIILCILGACLLVTFAAALGLAWMVFRLVGGI